MIKAKTVLTKKQYISINTLHLKKSKSVLCLYAVLEIFFIFIIISSLAFNNWELDSSFLPLGIFSIFIPLFLIIVPRLSIRISGKNLLGTVFEYTFRDDCVTVLQYKTDEMISENRIKYSFFVKVYESKDSFGFYISKNQLFYLDKADITEGTVEELQNLIYSHIDRSKCKVR